MAIHVAIPGYDDLEQIGVGGMAAVYKARQTSIDKTVAIKLLFPYYASDKSFIERFQREAKAAARIQHENIVNIIDFGESEGSYFIVMEYYDGLTLEALLKQHGTLPLDIAVLIMLEVCYGLEAAHSADIVHRDIKPGNIIYTRQGGIKIADFGLAKKSDSVTMITQEGKVIGTPAYMSPEQAAGGAVGPQSDIFSLGVVAFESFCRRKPFEGTSYSEVLEKIQTQAPPSVADINPLIQPDFERIVARMLAKDEDKRYPRASDVIADIEEAMERFKITRDRRKLVAYISDPEAYNAKFREKAIARALSQGSFYMHKGQSHLDEAVLEFKRILYLDPNNDRARRNLERIRVERSRGERTVTIDAPVTADAQARARARRARARKPVRAGAGGGHAFRRATAAFLVLALLAAAAYAAVERGWLPRPEFIAIGNHPPSLDAPARVRATSGERVAFVLRAQDPDGDAVSFSARGLPKGAHLNEDGTFAWPVDVTQAGVFNIAFTANDGEATAEAVTVVEVTAASLEFDAITDIEVAAGKSATRRLRARSGAGADVSFSLAEGPEGMRVEGDRLTFRAADNAAAGQFAATVTATDGASTATQTVAVRVTPAPAPVVQAATGRVEWKLPEKADIYVDGALAKSSANAITLDLPPGRHTMRAELASGVVGWSETVDVQSDETTRIRAPALQYGELSVYYLGAVGELDVEGKPFAQQPPFSGVRMPAGDHTVTCRLSGEARGKELTVRIEPGRETVIEYEVGKEPVVTIEG